MKKAVIVLSIITLVMTVAITVAFGVHASRPEEPTVVCECVHEEQVMTVDDVVSKAGCDYFIVKDINSWAVLEPDVYMDREVVEINICDDTPNTLCLFIELGENEEPHIRKTNEN